jgi:hypothetical protein
MGPSPGDKSLLSRGHPVLPTISDGYPEPRGRYPCLTAPYAGCHCWHPRLACLIHAANVRSEPGSNPSIVFSAPPRGGTLFQACVRCSVSDSKELVRSHDRGSPHDRDSDQGESASQRLSTHPIGSRQQLVKDRLCDHTELAFVAVITASQW